MVWISQAWNWFQSELLHFTFCRLKFLISLAIYFVKVCARQETHFNGGVHKVPCAKVCLDGIKFALAFVCCAREWVCGFLEICEWNIIRNNIHYFPSYCASHNKPHLNLQTHDANLHSSVFPEPNFILLHFRACSARSLVLNFLLISRS